MAQSDREARRRDDAAALAALGVSPHEAAVFLVLGYGITLPPADVPECVVRETSGDRDSTSMTDAVAALASCLAKRWVQVIDEPALAAIRADLHAGGVSRPISTMPAVGEVDFTPAGAALWLRFVNRHFASHRRVPRAVADVVRNKTTHTYRTRAAADRDLEGLTPGHDDIVAVTDPAAIGPWRVQWWRRFPDGVRVVVERRKHDRYLGGMPERVHWELPAARCDAARLRHLLDVHNVTPAEWLALAALDEPSWDDAERWWTSEDRAGFAVTDAERVAGRDAAVTHGWLRTVNGRTDQEIAELLRSDPAVLAAPRLGTNRSTECAREYDVYEPEGFVPAPESSSNREGDIEFSPTGAALYRAISAEWLGPGWEDGLTVFHESYHEIRLYCEVEAGLRHALAEVVAQGRFVRGVRVAPAGPWCTHWWERFAGGYRMELVVGDP